ncbi:MAG TPA: SRPBCC domain-containing protein [Caulobacteraceae bacterium]
MPQKIEHRLGIRAPAEAIWELIGDVDGWKDWNPLYPKSRGALRIGSRLELEVALPGEDARAIQPVVLEWVPNEQLIWRLSMFGGLIKTTRYMEIEQLAGSACIFSNGEIFAGLLGPFMARRMRAPIRAGFAAMGEAVKARVERAWRPADRGPILDER